MLFGIGIVFDYSLSALVFNKVPFKSEILWALALVVFLFGLLRAVRRWQGIKDMRNFKGFSKHFKTSGITTQYAVISTILELIFMLFIGTIALMFFMEYADIAYPILAVTGFVFVESIVYLLLRVKNGGGFGIGVNKEVVAYFNREMKLYYFTGLKVVEIHSELIHFKYNKNLSLFLPTAAIKKEDVQDFKAHLIETLSDKNVYIDESFRKWE